MFRPLLLLLACPAVAAHAGEVRFLLTDAKNLPVADAVVSLIALDPPPGSPSPAVPGPPCEIAQQGKEFIPYVTALRAGTLVHFPNRDKVEHHVYSLSRAKKFEFPLYKPGQSEDMVFDKPGVVVIGCMIHDAMAAYVVVLETPWFAVTPADGRATLGDVPPGRYRAEVWQPRLQETTTREIVVAPETPGELLGFRLKLRPDPRHRLPSRSDY